MYRLRAVAGPKSGEAFDLKEGDNLLGRQNESDIVLATGKVSKRHCTLVINGSQITVRDEGSANGTFVNGAMIRTQALKPGDRLSVGDCVFQLVEVKVQKKALARAGGGGSGFLQATGGSTSTRLRGGAQVLPFPGATHSGATAAPVGPPSDMKGRLAYLWDQVVMPFFYNTNLTTEWRMLMMAVILTLSGAVVIVTVQPVISTTERLVIREIGRRARDLARQLVEINGPLFAAQQETKSDTFGFEKLDGVRMAVLTDLDSRIVAPASRLNQYLTNGPEAIMAVSAREKFRRGAETGWWAQDASDTVVAVEPVKLYNASLGKNVIVGMAIVSIDTTLSTPALGETSMFYSQGLILAIILGIIALGILSRLTLRPFIVLNEDLDRVLKGEMMQVTHEYKFEELNSLWEIINSLCQRASKTQTGGGDSTGGGGGSMSASDFEPLARLLGATPRMGVILCDSDQKILYLNSHFEEVSGIRGDRDLGQPLSGVVREQGLEQLVNDLFSRTGPGAEGVSEDYEFNGVAHRVTAIGFGSPGGLSVGTLFLVQKGEG